MKKGQAAMEFLMTYGWAILVVLLAVGSLSFFGVFDPGNVLPDQCVTFAGFGCDIIYAAFGKNVQWTILKFTVQNDLGSKMDQLDINVTVDGITLFNLGHPVFGTKACDYLSPIENKGSLENGESVTCGYYLPFIDLNVFIGDRIKGKIITRWVDIQGNVRVRNGGFAVTIENCNLLGC
jgi:hypothetical protein